MGDDYDLTKNVRGQTVSRMWRGTWDHDMINLQLNKKKPRIPSSHDEQKPSISFCSSCAEAEGIWQ